ncbi:MAG: D-glycero-beta-D-manno-heptose 1-phosphate adenylyltransferase [Phycisphaerales bacterium]|nr:D-glycero-beta-D-manno-heptose 1-phosphate adenylyltransferase [Phycisphaerales bacterium]
MDDLLNTLAAWKPFRAAVLGDFMLDQLVYGDAERLSADAPVPVLHVRRTEDRPGGAANVAMDLVALGASVVAIGVTGQDAEGRLLKGALERERVDASGLVEDASRPTTVKRNLIGLAQTRHPQKMFRVDYETRDPLSAETAAALLGGLERVLGQIDVLCIEDYNKGVCTPGVCQRAIAMARDAGVPVFVDPAAIGDYSKYRGCTAITPNRVEAERATGLPTHESADLAHNGALAARLAERLECEAAVLTLDRHGALLLERGRDAVAVPTVAREVYDVTGAGDIFLAALAAGRANALSWPNAVRLANAAAGLEVEVFGVVPIPLEKIHHQLILQHVGDDRGLRSLDRLLVEVRARRRSGERIVFTNGCFDVLHAGHATLLEAALAQGDFLIVGLNDDASIRRLKGPDRPVNTQEDRARLLGAMACVGAVVLFEQDTPLSLIEAIKPDVLVKGADWAGKGVVGQEVVEQRGGKVVLVEIVEGLSTTRTLERIRGVESAPNA